jgi:sulfonate transport system permease protein
MSGDTTTVETQLEIASEEAPPAPRTAPRGSWLTHGTGFALLRLLLLAVVLALWDLTGELVGVQWVSSPTLVAQRIGKIVADGTLANNTFATLEETFLGLVLGVLAGIVAGVLIARSAPVISQTLDPYIMGVYSLPRVALAPFFILWFGIGLESKVALVVSVVAFVVLFNVRQGVEGVDRDLIDALRSMRAGRWQMTRYVTIPAVVPWIISAVKISVGLALVSAVVGEMVGSIKGLGWYVTYSLNQFDMTGGVTSLLVMAALALLLYAIVGRIEQAVCRWQTVQSGPRTVQL